MTIRIREIKDASLSAGSKRFYFLCPGCDEGHSVIYPRWSWNGDFERPTFSPSIVTGFGENFSEERCHSFIRNGKIEFQNDCHHELKNQTIDLPDVSDSNKL